MSKPDYWMTAASAYSVVPDSVEKGLARILQAPTDRTYPEWWIEFSDLGADSYELLISRCDKGHATGFKSYRYLATITLFDKHLGKPLYELREDVYDKDGRYCEYHIFGKFKTLGGAVNSLIEKGTFTRNGRKAVEVYR